jgi:hypothetical protein
MNSTWQAHSGGLAWRWSGLFEQRRQTPTMVEEPSRGADHNAVVPITDFAAHSPLGSGEWFTPWSLRWGVPTRSSF